MSTPQSCAVDGISAAVLGADDPTVMRERWVELGIAEAVRFQPSGRRGEGLDGVDLHTTDRARVGERAEIGGVVFTLV
jgi:hypothetical protein